MTKACLLIPHYQNPEGLYKTIRSVHKDEVIDIIIVDDGSVGCTFSESVVIGAMQGQGQVFFIYLPENLGIEHALNRGLSHILAHGYAYVARIDCGDLSLGKRFAIQSEYLDRHPDIGIVGSDALAAAPSGKVLYELIMPHTDQSIRNRMFLNSMLIHPAVMFRTNILATTGLYPLHYKSAEDYGFFFSVIKHFKAANLPMFLVQIEINEKGISVSKRAEQVQSRIRAIKDNFYIGFYPVYGLIRNYILLFLPYKIILFLKKKKSAVRP